MKYEENIGVVIPHNIASQNANARTITVDVYDKHGIKLIEGVTPINSIHDLA